MRNAILVATVAVLATSVAGGMGCSAGEEGAAATPQIGETEQASTESQTCPNSGVSGCTGFTKCGSRVVAFTEYKSGNNNYPIDWTGTKGAAPVVMRTGLAFCKNKVTKDAKTGFAGKTCAALNPSAPG